VSIHCSQQKENQYSVEEGNIKLLTITIIKNTECNTNKQMELIYFSVQKNPIDTCFYEIYFLKCDDWKNNLLPKSCLNLNLQLKY